MTTNAVFQVSVHERISVVLVALVFLNLLNPFSPFITLAFNLLVAIYLLVKRRFHARGWDGFVLFGVFAVLAWLLLVILLRGEAELQIFLKYVRITVAILLFSIVTACAGRCAKSIVLGLNLTLGFHVLMIFAQLAVPEITYVSAPIFGFEREPTILEEYTLRKLGASSSYDTAALLSISALVFYYLQFKEGYGSRFFWLTGFAFLATLFSSRTGIALSFVIVTFIAIRTLLHASGIARLSAVTFLLALSIGAYQLLLPLALHSVGLSELDSSETNLVFAAADYGTTGTLEALTEDHLEPLNMSPGDMFLGYGIDPNSIHRYTDIGYVKFIYHVGIPGTVVIVLIHFYMLYKVFRILARSQATSSMRLVGQLLALMLIIGLPFNYKSLELYSRGYGDTIFLLFFFVIAWSKFDRYARPQRMLTTT